VNVLIEMNALAFARPDINADPEQVAAWYEAKARLHEHLADGGGPDATQELAYAAAAHQHALDLLASTNHHMNGAAA
jgi:hypothetical protein